LERKTNTASADLIDNESVREKVRIHNKLETKKKRRLIKERELGLSPSKKSRRNGRSMTLGILITNGKPMGSKHPRSNVSRGET